MSAKVPAISGRGVDYAKFCVRDRSGKVPVYVKAQARQWLKIVDGKSREAHIDVGEYEKTHKLLRLITHPDLGGTAEDGMEDYAIFMIDAIFSTFDNEGRPYYRTIVLEIARKNYKTFNSGVIFILLMLKMRRFGRYFSVAPDLKLSKELQIAIKKIIKSSPLLNRPNVFKILRSEIRCQLTESEYTPLAYSEDKMDGKLANAFLADEAGAMDAYPIEAMRSSQITLPDGIGIIISTQYPNDNNAMIDEIDISKKVLDGLLDGQRRFSLLFEPDDYLQKDDLWKTDDRVLYQANPVAVKNKMLLENLKQLRAMAALYANRRENFLCKHCNIKYKSLGVEGYIDVAKVQRCVRIRDDSWWRGRLVFVGVDLSQTEDNTAVSMLCMENGVLYIRSWGFIPGDAIEAKSKREGVDYNRLIAAGDCFASGSEVIDYPDIERFVFSLREIYGVEIVQLGYDRWNALSSVQKWEAGTEDDEPIECVEVVQHSKILHSPTKLLKEKILSRQCRYDENRMLEINFQNARCTEDTNLNKYVNKKKSKGKVDMVMSILNALYLAQQSDLYPEDDTEFDAYAL